MEYMHLDTALLVERKIDRNMLGILNESKNFDVFLSAENHFGFLKIGSLHATIVKSHSYKWA